jgi:hypothetical protein
MLFLYIDLTHNTYQSPIAIAIASRACSIFTLSLILDKCGLNELTIKIGSIIIICKCEI